MDTKHERADDMPRLLVEIVTRPIEVRRHRGDEVATMLFSKSLAQHKASDLGNGIPTIRWFERARQQSILSHRLLGQSRINAGGTEKQQF